MMSWNDAGVINLILIVELVKLLLMMHGILDIQLSGQWKNYLKFVILYLIIFVAGCGTNIKFIVSELLILTSFIYYILNARLILKFLLSIFSILAVNIMDSLIISIFVKMHPDHFKNFMDLGLARASANIVGMLLLFILAWFKKRKRSNHLNLDASKQLLVVVIILFSFISILLGSAEAIYIGYNNKKLEFSFIISCIILVMLVFGVCLLLIMVVRSEQQLKQIAELNEKIILNQKEHYERTIRKDTDLRKFRHDYNSHMYVLKQLSKNKDYISLTNYIDELIEFRDMVANITVGNSVADAVLNDIYQCAKKKEIEFTCLGKLPDTIGIKDIDICILFSNMLKNAMEAVERQTEGEKRYIHLEISNYRKNLFITSVNSFNRAYLDANLQTSKRDFVNHGYGMELIKNIVEKYKGNIAVDVREQEFEVRITF